MLLPTKITVKHCSELIQFFNCNFEWPGWLRQTGPRSLIS